MDQSFFTVYFEDPYWVGVFELIIDGSYSAARIVFGAEPTDAQILEYLSKNYPNNVRFTQACKDTTHSPSVQRINPKRKQREAAHLLKKTGSSTKAQEAVQQAYENYKQEKQAQKRLINEEQTRLKYLQKVEKKKQKKRGK